jgi:hypothetical protein
MLEAVTSVVAPALAPVVTPRWMLIVTAVGPTYAAVCWRVVIRLADTVCDVVSFVVDTDSE